MGTKSNSKEVATTTTMTKGNTSGSPAVQQTGMIVEGGGAGMSSADKGSVAGCTKAGHPVDVVTGAVVDESVDIALPGLISVEWKRLYSSTFSDESTPLGKGGWTYALHQFIDVIDGDTVLRNEDGRNLHFPLVAPSDSTFRRAKRLTLKRGSGDTYEVYSLDTRLTRVFAPVVAGGRPFLREIRDPHGNAVKLTYAADKLVTVVDTAKREIRLAYDQLGRIIRVDVWSRGAIHQSLLYEYADGGELWKVTDALGYAETFEYDGYHRLVKTTLKNGVSFHYLFKGDSGRCIRTWGDGGLYTAELLFDDDAHTTVVTGNPAPRKYTYNAKKAVTRVETLDAGVVVEKDYDDDLFVLAERNGLGEETHWEYDERANLVKKTDAAGNETTFEYVDDLLRRIIAPGDLVTELERSSLGDLVGIRQPTGASRTAAFDEYGRIVGIYAKEGPLTRVSYDDEHNRMECLDLRGAATRYEYDALGLTVRRVDPLGRETRVEYDAKGQPTAITAPDGARSEFSWNALGLRTRVLNPLGEEVVYEYAGVGSLVRLTLPGGRDWRFAYDKEQRLLSIENPKAELYEFRYDRAGRVNEERTFDGRVLRYSFDLAGRLGRIEYPDDSWRTFEYNSLGRVTREASPDGDLVFVYDSVGRVLKATVEEMVGKTIVEYRRDAFGRIISEKEGEFELTYEYKPDDWLTVRRLSGGETTRYYVDPYNDIARIEHEGQRVTFERDAAHREVRRWAQRGGVEIQWNYSVMDNLLAQDVSAPSASTPGARSTIAQRSWEYDALGQPRSMSDRRWGTTRYDYDPLGELVAARNNARELFDYDAAGSVERQVSSLFQDASTWAIRQGNVLVRTGTHEYSYDERHRRVAKRVGATGATTAYLWDCRDRLREIRLPDGGRVSYTYDAFGRRVRKETLQPPAALDQRSTAVATARTTRYQWDGFVLAAEVDSDRGRRVFVHAPSSFVPVLQQEQGEVFTYVVDGMGTPRELVDSEGRVAWSAHYSAWGLVDGEQADPQSKFAGRVSSPLRFQGQYFDEESGLSYNWHRYFDPAVARWLSPDPLGIYGGSNAFAFDIAPTVGADPMGLASFLQTGTYGSLTNSDDRGDGMDAHELLQNAWLKANDIDGYSGRGSGISQDNPSIALPGYPRVQAGQDSIHKDCNAAQDAWEDDLGKMKATENINKNADALYDAMVKRGVNPKLARKKVDELKKQALAFAKAHVPKCKL